MSALIDLIAAKCPIGVEFKQMSEVGEFIRGNGLLKKDLSTSGFPAIHYGQVHTHYGTWAAETKSYVKEDVATKLRKAKPGDIVLATTSEDDEAVAKAVAWLGNEEVAVSGDAHIYRHSLDPKFVSFFFQTDHFHRQKMVRLTGAKVRRISAKSLGRIHIPVPPLEIQREIASILDRFEKLEAQLKVELEAELVARRLQYRHYRKMLLMSKDEKRGEPYELKKLHEVGNFVRGTAMTKKQVTKGSVPVVANGPEPVYSHGESNRSGETVVIARSGANAGYVSYWNQPIFLTDAFSIEPHANVLLPKYLFYVLKNMEERLREMKKGHGVPHVQVKEVSAIEVPVPSIKEQTRIIDILDRLEARVTELSDSLPSEIRARKGQYTYYRNHLMGFEKAA